jgi:hypothetical protein
MAKRILVWIIILLGLLFWSGIRMTGAGLFTPFWWVEVVLFLILIAGFGAGRGLNLMPPWPLLAFGALIWACGMGYELTLTLDGTGIGGVHPDTRASFILAQFDYLAIAAVTVWAVWFWRLAPSQVLMIAAGKSLTEGLIFSGILRDVLTDPAQAVFAPLMASYYVLAYATFMVAPLFIINPQALWRPGAGWRPNLVLLVAFGFVAGFVIRVVWGLGYAPLATTLFALPPNPIP